ncbi:tRNA lysidine(34) synthetase TilS [Bacillus xiapuensis]|uniref:tRNA lysidine(34) synthetase TilS n=1 Tax=Bacillus xiapuensis TaxID=2014075 RepID=UPI000C24DCA1|nr:tRNA lysidine(34) synthetase TilS [Bacillus xiapuensis]
MQEFEKQVERFIEHHQLIRPGDRIAVGVSGGPDSLALLSYLAKKREAFGIEIFALHLDHMFRGEESYAELKFVENFCQLREIPFMADRIDVRKLIESSSMGLQEAARHVRYHFYERGMAEFSANKLALAHHGDDQVETILMQLTKGAGRRIGIPVRRSFANQEMIRPLLSVNKEMIEQYCVQEKLDPRRDPSNEKMDYMRNRFRHHLLPFLKKENPRVHEHFQRFSEEQAEDEQLLREWTAESMQHVWEKNGSGAKLKVRAFLEVPLPLQRRGIHLILNYLYKGKIAYSFIHIQQILQLLKEDQPSGSLNLPHGLQVHREYNECFFSFEMNVRKDYVFTLDVGERVDWPFGGSFFLTDELPVPAGGADCLRLDQQSVKLPLYVRTRSAGDRISLKGMNGTKKLKRLFIDEKIPRIKRDQWPVIADSSGKVLWVPGLRKSKYDRADAGNYFTLIYNK